MKPLISRRSAATTLIVFASLFASLLIGSVFAESASMQVLTDVGSDVSPRSLEVSNGKIAFGGNTTVGVDTRDEVFVMDPNGSNQTAITSLGGLDPFYSP
ncbi:MAG: hypothetical protein ABR568_18065, partial [Pyrinomonadaceae bacterium]